MPRLQALRDDELKRLPECLVGPVTEDPLGTRVSRADDPVTVGHHHRTRGGREDGVGCKSGQIHLAPLVLLPVKSDLWT